MTKTKGDFVHLHVHTDYSKLDGMETVKEVADFVAADGQPAVAVTDHGGLPGYVKFEKACKAVGVQPIPGTESYFVDSFERIKEEKDRARQHMLLLAVNDDGYRNLLKITSEAYLNQYYYKPLVDEALIARHSSGILMTTGCIGGPIGQALQKGDEEAARAVMARHRDIVGADRYFAEIQPHDFPEQQTVNRLLVPLAKRMGVPLIATQDSHYVGRDRALAHEKMLAMQTNSALSDPNRFKFASLTNYMATAEEMRRMVPNDLYPGACDNTLLIAEMAKDVTPKVGSHYLIPAFPGAEAFGGEQAMLRSLVIEGVRERYGLSYGKEVEDRVNYELEVIHEMGFDAYFLIVWDLVKWAKDNGIAVGPGRGSAAGSIVSYSLDITTLDPLRYGLYFERFLNPGRKSMPDIDIDFERDRRAEVRAYLVNKYGYDHVSYIATQGRFHGRSAIKSASRIYEIPPKQANSLSSTFPMKTKLTIAQMLGDAEELPRKDDNDANEAIYKDWSEGADFRAAVRNEPLFDSVIETAADVEGYIQNFGVHAAGVLITPQPLTDFVPLTNETTDKTIAVCAYDKEDVEDIGGLKMDLLGLINLTTIKECVGQIEENYGKQLDVNTLPLDDEKTFSLLRRADTEGIFQLGSSGMKELLRRLQPDRFDEIAALLALYRPGPMGSDMHWDYADRKNGRQRIIAEHPDMLLDHLFGDTHGMMIFQEQLIAMVQHFAGFTAGEADTLRKATGKKDSVLIAAQEGKFKQGMSDQGFDKKLADALWAKIPPFAQYSFNKSHAVAYAMISYQTAYLKAHYPAEYAAACVDTLANPALQMQWAKASGVTFDVPDINESGVVARAFQGKVRLGLSGIKGVGASICSSIVAERKRGGPFTSLGDFLSRAVAQKINKTGVEGLIEAGALDSLHGSRGEMLRLLPSLMNEARASVARESSADDEWGDGDMFGDVSTPELKLSIDSDAKESMRLSQRIGRQTQRLGVFLGEHPMTLFDKHLLDRIPDVSRVVSPDIALGDVMVHGVLSAIETKNTRKSQMHTLTLEAADGYSLNVKLFGDADDIKAAGLGALIIVEGVLQEDDWAKEAQQGDDNSVGGGEVPRELLVNEAVVIPLSALDTADSETDKHNILITLDDDDAIQDVASAMKGALSPGMRFVVVSNSAGETTLPQTISETAEEVAELLAKIEDVRVSRA